MGIFNKKERNLENNDYPIKGFVDFCLVVCFIIYTLLAISSGFSLMKTPSNFILLVYSLFMVVVTLRVMDNNVKALYCLLGAVYVNGILNFFLAPTHKDIIIAIIQMAFWTLIFLLPKNGEMSWSIIHDTPQEQTIIPQTTKIIYVVSGLVALSIVAGFILWH